MLPRFGFRILIMAKPKSMADPQSDRAKKTLYVTGFNPKHTSKRLLDELFTQGGPVKNITLFNTHAYVLFHHEESVAYCLALFNEVELHGQKLRLNPKFRTRDTFCYMRYLVSVREKLMREYMKIPPPDLPPRQAPVKEVLRSERDQPRDMKKNRKSRHKKSKVKQKKSR